jgi:hypothetical protein
MFEKFDDKDKRRVFSDWAALFPSMKRYKTRTMCNRVGPLVISMSLDMYRPYNYTPKYSVHNLCREFEALTATLRLQELYITPERHEERYRGAAKSLIERAYIPIEGDMHIDEIIEGYVRYFSQPIIDTFIDFADLAWVCGWTRRSDKIEHALKTIYDSIQPWKDRRYFTAVSGSFENWFKEVESRAWDGDKLNEIYEAELVKHKLEKIPVRQILLD